MTRGGIEAWSSGERESGSQRMPSSFSCDQVNVCNVTRVFLMTSEGIRCCEAGIDRIEIRGTRYQKLAARYFRALPHQYDNQPRSSLQNSHPCWAKCLSISPSSVSLLMSGNANDGGEQSAGVGVSESSAL